MRGGLFMRQTVNVLTKLPTDPIPPLQTCQLVLGAGAMRTAGLRSISAKQLALSCQCVAMLAALHPLLRAGSLALVSQPRRALLIPEFDRLLTDLTLHTDEIHTKLVDIMSDRLAAATAALPAELQQVGE
jgi:vacuolar protein sorting-associated protein 54